MSVFYYILYVGRSWSLVPVVIRAGWDEVERTKQALDDVLQ